MSSRSAVQAWLQTVLAQAYIHRDIAFTHVDALLVKYSALSPRTASYTHDDGRTQLLLCLQGTIPIQFKGKPYNIPLAVWLPFEYPRQPPIVYVVPTAVMLVRASNLVEVSGRCTGPYLRGWERKSEGCSLVDLVAEYQTLFGREPPVYAKPSMHNNAAGTNSSGSTSTPTRPTTNTIDSQPTSREQSTSGPRPAPLPPTQNSAQSNGTPPFPQRPSTSNSVKSTDNNESSRFSQQFPNQLPLRPPSAVPSRPQSTQFPSNFHPAPNQTNDQQQNRPGQTPRMPSQPYPVNRPVSGDFQQRQQLTTAPKRPTNPEIMNLRSAVLAKMTDALNMQAQTHHAEMLQLEALHSDLLKGEPAIKDEMGRLEAVKNVCENVRDRYAGAVDGIRANIQTLDERDPGSVDEILTCQSVLHSQLLDLVAEDNALEDTIYQLGQGLYNDNAKIDIDIFLKRVRPLARDQFLKRALVNKILLDLAVSETGHQIQAAR